MRRTELTAGAFLGASAVVVLAVGFVSGGCGDTLVEQVFSVTAVPSTLMGLGLVADRAAGSRDRRTAIAGPVGQ